MASTAPDGDGGRTTSATQTRARLIEHGRAAFAAKGHDNVSLHKDVLEPAGVSNGSFYHQFRDKTDLLVAVLEDGRERARSFIDGATEDAGDVAPLGQAVRRLTLWLQVIEAGEDMYRIMIREQANPDERVRTLVADFRTGSFVPLMTRLNASMASLSDDFDARRAVDFVKDLVQSAALHYLDLPAAERAEQRDDIARDLGAFIIGGITGMARIPNPSGVDAR